MKLKSTLLISLFVASSFAIADDNATNYKEGISNKLKAYFNGQDIVNYVAETPVANTYMVTLADGTNMIYFNDTDYAVVGDMYNMKNRENISSNLKSGYNKEILNNFKPEEGIVFKSTNPNVKERIVYVFTDPTCGYCRKLHQGLAEYQAQGITITYLPFPRGGKGGFAYNELVDVWCSKDKRVAIDLAKNDRGEEIKTAEGYNINESCKAVVDKGYELGNKLGITGTPSLFTESGFMFPGYVEPARLREMVDKAESN